MSRLITVVYLIRRNMKSYYRRTYHIDKSFKNDTIVSISFNTKDHLSMLNVLCEINYYYSKNKNILTRKFCKIQ